MTRTPPKVNTPTRTRKGGRSQPSLLPSSKAPGLPSDLSHIVEALRPLAVPLAKLKPDPKNLRLHPADNLDLIENLLRKYGQDEPLVVRAGTNTILAGNGRFEVMVNRLHWTHAAVVFVEQDANNSLALAITDNRSGDTSTFDRPALFKALRTLQFTEQRDMLALGWTSKEIDALMSDKWDVAPLNLSQLPVYDPDAETFHFRIDSVPVADAPKVLDAANRALQALGITAVFERNI